MKSTDKDVDDESSYEPTGTTTRINGVDFPHFSRKDGTGAAEEDPEVIKERKEDKEYALKRMKPHSQLIRNAVLMAAQQKAIVQIEYDSIRTSFVVKVTKFCKNNAYYLFLFTDDLSLIEKEVEQLLYDLNKEMNSDTHSNVNLLNWRMIHSEDDVTLNLIQEDWRMKMFKDHIYDDLEKFGCD